ncbi:single-stranded DNA-binding protein [Macrococcoides caseolyticum]|uniref:single-stranded DNA-binding protein n=1 Tax=Macrococcoides caseolyticum TaxID=69966 RepID=UPI000C3432C8|nr:single-stranded DNA-binding protein [Macrococcus caseolyticus]PKE25131.1 single-stranded DNA-binding protein [Macrococcus caseolyticus]
MINRVVLTGRLTKNPEFRVTTSGVSVATFTLAVNRMFTNDQGEKQADFINCVTFRKQAENVNNFLSKASLVGVDGRLQSRSYDNKEGQRVYVTEVICDSVQFLEPKNSQNQQNNGVQQANHTQTNNNNQNNQNVNRGQNNANNGYSQQHENPFANSSGSIDIQDDDLPF